MTDLLRRLFALKFDNPRTKDQKTDRHLKCQKVAKMSIKMFAQITDKISITKCGRSLTTFKYINGMLLLHCYNRNHNRFR